MFLPLYEEFRLISKDSSQYRFYDVLEGILSIILAIAAFICELWVRLNRYTLGLLICSTFLIIWRSIFWMLGAIEVLETHVGVGCFLYLGGGLLLLWATATVWVDRRRASRTRYSIRWPYVLGGGVLLLVPFIWRMSQTATPAGSVYAWSFRLYLTSIVIAAALTIVPRHITDVRRDASLTAFTALAITHLAFPISLLLRHQKLSLGLQNGYGLVELAAAVCVWIVLIPAQQTATQGVVPASTSRAQVPPGSVSRSG
jgi:hypothetical protein